MMKKVAFLMLLTLVLLPFGEACARSDSQPSPEIRQLADQAFRLYSARETDRFLATVKKIKKATESTKYEETYYRICSYEAIYMFEYIDRQQGVQLAHDIYHNAKTHNSNVGMYFATFTLGTIREQSGNMGLAEKSFLQALKLKERYLPDESAAPCYLGLCETALHRKGYEEVKEYARKALEEPGIIPMNQITAWSYKCLARYNQGDSLGFEEAYKERKQLIAKYGGQGGLFGELINVYQAKNRKQWKLALQRADKLIHQQNKCAQKASIYEHMGDLRQALYWQKRTRAVIDSIQSSEARSQMNEFDTELSLTYAENEMKELNTLANRLFEGSGNIAPDQTAAEVLKNIYENALGADNARLEELFRSPVYQKLIGKALGDKFTLKPGDITSSEDINEFYKDTYSALSKLSEIAEKEGSLAEKLSKPMDNIKFMDTLNDVFPYIQLPLKLTEGNTRGELYVFKNGRKKSDPGDSQSVLLHLDMKNLGPTDIHMELKSGFLKLRFYCDNDDAKNLLEDSFGELEAALTAKNYHLTSEFSVRETETSNIVEALSGGGEKVPEFKYNFDIRA